MGTKGLPGLLKGIPLIAALCLVGAGVAATKDAGFVELGPAPAEPTDFPILATETPSALPVPSQSPVAEIDGIGPLLFFAERVPDALSERWNIVMVDAAEVSSGSEPVGGFVREIQGVPYGAVSSFQSSGSALLVFAADQTGSGQPALWAFRRGPLPTEPLIDDGIEILSAVPSANGQEVAVLRKDVSGVDGATLWRYPSDRGAPVKVMEVRAPRGEIGIPIPWAWFGSDLLAFPSCECDFGLPLSAYSLSLKTRKTAAAAWLGTFSPSRYPAVSADGGTFAFVRETPRDCPPESEVFPCFGPPSRLYVAQASRRTIRQIAATNELAFDNATVSPDGKLVAYATGRNNEIVVRETASGREYTTVSERLINFQPWHWVSSDSFLAEGFATDIDGAGSPGVLELVTLHRVDDGDPRVEVEIQRVRILDGDATYLGWLR